MDETFADRIEWWATPRKNMVIVHARLTLDEWGQVEQYDVAVLRDELDMIQGGERFWLEHTWPGMRYKLLAAANNSAR